MATNVELKARAHHPDRQRALAIDLAGVGELIEQEDTFFHVPTGRLKLRTFSPEQGELIFYSRSDEGGPRPSNYSICPTDRPSALRDLLGAVLGIRGTVRKRRHLFLVGQTRIHIDEVEGLGTFLELEVVLRSGQTVEEGQRIADDLRRRLGIRAEDLIDCAYIDLLEGKS
jgi:adenylate cyclase class IV